MKEENNEPVARNSFYGTFCLLLITTTHPLLQSYHLSWMNPALVAIHSTFNQTYLKRHGEPMPESTWLPLLAISATAIVIAACISGMASTYVLNYISSKLFSQLCHVVSLLSIAIISLAGGLTGSYEAIIVGRFIAGLLVGSTYVIIPMLVTELCARKQQEFWQSIVGVSISFGLFITPIISHPMVLGSVDRWPFILTIAVVPSVIYLSASLRLPQTPYYFLRKGRKEEAIKTLQQLRIGNVEEEVLEIENEINHGTKNLGIKEIITTKQYRNQLFAVLVLYANLALTGVLNIIFYSDQVFIKAGIASEIASFATIGVFALQFIAACFGSKLIDRIGGLKVSIAANIVFIVVLILFTVSQATVHLAPSVMPYLSIVSISIFLIAWSGGSNLATVTLSAEFTIEPTRATCLSYGSFICWFASFLVGFLPPYLQVSLKAYSMVIWLACTILLLIYMVIFFPETKGKTVEEIQAKFIGKKTTNLPLEEAKPEGNVNSAALSENHSAV